MPHKKRSYPFTVIEVFIAFGIGTLIISSLLFYLKEIFSLKNEIAKTKIEIEEEAFFMIRLNRLFAHFADDPHLQFEEKGNHFLFTYDGRLDPDPEFRGDIKGDLALEEDQLILSMTSQKSGKMRKETLLHKAKDLEWHFFQMEKMNENTSDKSFTPNGLHLKAKGKEFAFFFPTYTKGIPIKEKKGVNE